jgi:predicted transcriptional regulator
MDIPSVKDFMRKDVIVASVDEPMSHLIDKLLSKGVSGAPVFDDKCTLVGVISGKDVLQGLSVDTFHRMGSGTVEDYMSTNVFSIDQDKDVFSASHIFCTTNYRRLPVVDDNGVLVGIVTRKDVIKALDKLSKDKILEMEERWRDKEK